MAMRKTGAAMLVLLIVGLASLALAEAAKLPALKSTITDAIKELDDQLGGNAAPGVIVHQRGRRVYVNLGEKSGMRMGDRFDILGSNGEVAGSFVVTGVQEKLCAGKMDGGRAEAKDAKGEWNAVRRRRRACQVAEVTVQDGAEIAELELRQSICAALRSCKALDLVEGYVANPDLMLRATASPGPADGGCTVSLQVVRVGQNEPLAKAEKFHRTEPTLAELGFQSAVAARLADRLDLERTLQVLGSGRDTGEVAGAVAPIFRVRQPRNYGRRIRALHFRQAGPGGEVGWVFEDGTALAASKNELSEPQRQAQLQSAWMNMAVRIPGSMAHQALESRVEKELHGDPRAGIRKHFSKEEAARVFASSSSYDETSRLRHVLAMHLRTKLQPDLKKLLEEQVRKTAVFLTPHPEQYQRLCVDAEQPLSFDGWVLDWPAAEHAWGQIELDGVIFPAGSWALDGKTFPDIAKGHLIEDWTGIRPGKHSLRGSVQGRGGYISITGFFPKPKGKIVLRDKDGKAVVTREVMSADISKVYVPASETRAPLETPRVKEGPGLPRPKGER